MNTAGQISWTCQKAARSCLRQTVAELKYIDEKALDYRQFYTTKLQCEIN